MRPILWMDFETGGVECWTHSPLSFAMLATQGPKIIGEWYTQIREAPYVVTSEAMAINKLNLEDPGLTFLQFRKEYFTRLNNWFYGGNDYQRTGKNFFPGKTKASKTNMPKFGGHNTWFDRQCLQRILGGTPTKDIFDGAYYHRVDTMVLASAFQEIGLIDTAQPLRLENLCGMLDVKNTGDGEFHNALVDLKMTFACYLKMCSMISK